MQAGDPGLDLLNKAKVLLIQGEDPWQDPTGGIVATTKCLLRAFGDRVAVASPSEHPMRAGVWLSRPFEGQELAYFSLGPLGLVRGKKPLVPAKVLVYLRAKKYMAELHRFGVRNLLMDCAEVLLAARSYAWDSVCYRFPGVYNPVAYSRYRWARILGRLYERQLIRALRGIRPDAIIAAADDRAIERFREGPGRILDPEVLHSFPTRVDTNIFFPEPRVEARTELGLALDDLTMVACGRLSWTKGWPLLLSVLQELTRQSPAVRLVFVGDGEDRPKILQQAAQLGLEQSVTITGLLPQNLVRTYINAADVCVVASHVEGWSVAMLEALACGRPLVSTQVSGADSMIRAGRNGFVLGNRDPQRFAAAVSEAAKLPDASRLSVEIAERYSLKYLARDLGRLWKPLAGGSGEDFTFESSS